MKNDDPILVELFALLAAQPSRLADGRLRPQLLDGQYSKLLAAMKVVRMKGGKQTPENILLESKDESLAKLASSLFAMRPSGSSMDSIVQYLFDQKLREVVRNLSMKGYDACGNPKSDMKDIVSEMQAGLIQASGERFSPGAVLANDFTEVDEEIRWTMENPGRLRGPSTGFYSLDRALNGLTPRYYVIGARPSVGKSALMGNIAEALLEVGLTFLLFTYEMPTKNYLMRMLARKARVPIGSYRGSPFTSIELRAIDEAKADMSKWKLIVNDDPSTTIDQIESTAYEVCQKGPLGAIGIDYLQLINCKNSKGNRNDYISEVSGRLKLLSRRLDVPVIVLSQLKRLESSFVRGAGKSETKRPELHDLRESGSIEQDADMVGLLHRETLADVSSAELIIAKQRDGQTHDGIKMNYKPTILSFEEA